MIDKLIKADPQRAFNRLVFLSALIWSIKMIDLKENLLRINIAVSSKATFRIVVQHCAIDFVTRKRFERRICKLSASGIPKTFLQHCAKNVRQLYESIERNHFHCAATWVKQFLLRDCSETGWNLEFNANISVSGRSLLFDYL